MCLQKWYDAETDLPVSLTVMETRIHFGGNACGDEFLHATYAATICHFPTTVKPVWLLH